jgi:hypothetical protein
VLDNQKCDLLLCESQHLTQTTLEAIKKFNLDTIVFGVANKFDQLKLLCLNDEPLPHVLANLDSPYYILGPATSLDPIILNHSFNFDVLFISDIQDNLLPYIDICKNNHLSVKIVGDVPINCPEYLGKADITDRMFLFSSASFTILQNNFHIYDVAISNGMAIIQSKNDTYPTFTSPEDLLTKIKLYQPVKMRYKICKQADKEAREHTYYNHMANILTQTGHESEAQICLNQLSKVLEL